ncbi:MAG: hypothetical protein GY898_00220 [Proteobacteria bacterium]|nr:hypothetical protein [Pseudomonadota bacterium]
MSARSHQRSIGPASSSSSVQRAPAAGGSALDPNSVQGRGSQYDAQRADVGVQFKKGRTRENDPHVGDGEDGPAVVRETPMGGETAIVLTRSGNLHLRDEGSMDGKILDKYPAGTVVTQHAKKGEWINVKVWAGNGGKAGWMHGKYLKTQPGLTLKDDGDDKGNPQDYDFTEAVGKAFDGKPNAEQAMQGAIGDCYLIAAMGALASTAGGQAKLMSMVSPHGVASSYKVTFSEEQRDGSFKPVNVSVDAWMPTSGGKFKYALNGKPAADGKTPIWAPIIEKAYAQWKGGYEEIGGGGSPGGAMSEMAGVDVSYNSISSIRDDKTLTDAIKDNIANGKSMTAATKSKLGKTNESAFSGSGAGPYTASLDNVVVERSVKITDKEGAAPDVHDDGKGKLTAGGKDAGTVDYKKAKFNLTYPETGPGKPDDLTLACDVKYWLNRSPDIVANHAYVVKGATDDAVELHNPWGSYHPGKVPLKTFRETYQAFSATEALGTGEDA